MMDSKVQVCLSTEDNRGVFMVVGMVEVDALTANIPWHSTMSYTYNSRVIDPPPTLPLGTLVTGSEMKLF